MGYRRGKWEDGERKGGRREKRLWWKFSIVCCIAVLPASLLVINLSAFLAPRLSYLDPSLFLVPGTVNLAICCIDGPFQRVPLLTSSRPAVRAASSKGRTPWEEEYLPSN